MSPGTLLIAILLLSIVAYYVGRKKAFAIADRAGGIKELHSRPTYYGALTALWCSLPVLIIFGFWQAFETNIITSMVVSELPKEIQTLPADRLNLVVNDIKNLVSGNITSGEISPAIKAAADRYRSLNATGHAALSVIALSLCILCALLVGLK